MMDRYNVFKVLSEGEKPPQDYEKIVLLWVFDVKFDLRHRSRLVAGGHLTEELPEESYSSTTSIDDVRLIFVIAALMDLRVIAADVGHAFI